MAAKPPIFASLTKKLACLTNYQERRSFPWPLVLLCSPKSLVYSSQVPVRTKTFVFMFVFILPHEHSNKNRCSGTIIRQCRVCCLPVGRQFCRIAGGNVRRRRVDRSWCPQAPPPRQGTRCNRRIGLSFLKRRKF